MKKVLIVIALLAVTGCSMKEAEPLKVYTFSFERITPVSQSRYRNKTIKVSYPQTAKEKLTDKMSYSYSSSERGFYQNSKWFNNLGKLVQGSVIQALDESRIFKAVLPYESTAGEDLRLESTIFDFSHHVRGDASYAVVSIRFSLIETYTGKLIKTRRFSYREDTVTTDAEGYVKASNKAMERLLNDLAAWLR
jgi:cholesterol transport system auxiliary component